MFLTADYCSSEENLDEYMKLIEIQKQSADILISTSVLDNGISLKDSDLKNIIIMADNETEFIQMLGRKREDDNRITLYLYKYEKSHFVSRINNINKKIDYAGKVYNNIFSVINDQKGKYNDIISFNYIECKQMVFWHKYLMQALQRNYFDIKDTFVTVGNYLFLNPLSLTNLENLREYYNEIVEKFGNDDNYDDDAFMKMQLYWMGLRDEKYLEEAKMSREDRAKNRLIKEIQSLIDDNKNSMSEKECIDFQKIICDDMEILIRHSELSEKDKTNKIKNVKQGDRPFTAPQMEFLNKTYGIPYEITTGNGRWTIKEKK